MKTILLTLFSIVLLIIYIQTNVYKVTSITIQATTKPDFHFEIVNEVIGRSEYPLTSARILIDRKDYTKANLEALFKWYSSIHARKSEMLTVLVFTNMDYLLADKQVDEIQFFRKFDPGYKPDKPVTIGRNGPPYDAFFTREISHSGDIEEVNELYSYSPDLDQPNIRSTIIMKGRDPWAH